MDILSSRFMLHPRDFDRSLAFYRDVLGLHPMREFGAVEVPPDHPLRRDDRSM